MSTRYGLDREDLGVMLRDQPRYRVDQVWTGLYEQLAAPDELTNLPKALRTAISRARAVFRANWRLATFAQAMISTQNEAPSRSQSDRRMPPTCSSFSGTTAADPPASR